MNAAGKVVLVGAGPGDPDLITRKGLRFLHAADAVVYDRLSSPELLAETKAGCELVSVGKASACHTMPQAEINERLVELAKRYPLVVRLKGGDPFVFGRGGEELAYLAARGIACELVPGVTSAVAVPESVGIPVTQRGVATSFRVITAQGENFTAADLDYASMRDPKTTLVFLMGLAQVGTIAEGLLTAGRAPTTPIAVISSGTTQASHVVRGALSEIAARVTAAGLPSPATIVVGDVAVFGCRCLVAKVGPEVARLSMRLRAAGAVVDEVQVGRIRLIPEAIDRMRLAAADWVVVTSVHAVEALDETALSVLRGKGTRIAAVGPTTAAAASARGLRVAVVPAVANARALMDELLAHVASDDVVLRLLPEGVADSLAELAARCRYGTVCVYANEPLPRPPGQLLSGYDAVFCTSASCRARLDEWEGGMS